MPDVRTLDDLHRAARSICRHFNTNTVVVIGSQAVLVDWPEAPELLRSSGEIDLYPGNIREWEAAHPGELASEEINALFGWGSRFHDAFGFYIDGVDEDTAKLPPGWEQRAIVSTVRDGDAVLKVIAPCPEDLVISKLLRLEDKDRDYIAARHDGRPLDIAEIKDRLRQCRPSPEVEAAAMRFLDTLAVPET